MNMVPRGFFHMYVKGVRGNYEIMITVLQRNLSPWPPTKIFTDWGLMLLSTSKVIS